MAGSTGGLYVDPITPRFYDPATPLDINAIEAAIVEQLKNSLSNYLGRQVIEVTHFPDKPEAYELRHRIGVAMVIYMGSTFGDILDVGHVAQERTMRFAIGVRIRDLGWAFGGPASGTSPGAYQVLEAIRLALTGFQPSTGCTKMAPEREHFLERDKQGGVWVYEMVFMTRTVTVEDYRKPNYPLFIHGTVQEEGGVTGTSIGLAVFQFMGTPNTIALGPGNISDVLMKSLDLSTTYTLGVDYTVDTVNGIIQRLTTGAISQDSTVLVSYTYADVVTALASGGAVPFAPQN